LNPYSPPNFTAQCSHIPASKVSLGMLPTPIHNWKPLGTGFDDVDCFIKRDDLSGCDVSGNKVRKLEFLMAKAMEGDYDSVITIGGTQSNHARATACVARQLGYEPHLILRGKMEEGYTLVGNLLFDKMVGAKIWSVSPDEYGSTGQAALLEELRIKLKGEGKNPYVIPVGGSNGIGIWGYIEFVREFMQQCIESNIFFDHLLFACGSGGTAAGISLGFRMYKAKLGIDPSNKVHIPKVHGVGVCDSPDVFYEHIREMAQYLDLPLDELGDVKEWINIYDGQGLGYAKSKKEELEYLTEVAAKTGIIADPVYSGKALFYAARNSLFQPGDRVCFLHTGGIYGNSDKAEDLLALLPRTDVQHSWRSL
jgi:D-cysteine desulfhydrase